MSPKEPVGKIGHEHRLMSEATIERALKSILAQFVYDVLNMIFYTVVAVPSLIAGAGVLLYSSCIEKDKPRQEEQKKFAEVCLGNVVLGPYFAVSIVVDFLREFAAFFTRTYATAVQTQEEKGKLAYTMG